MFALSDDLQLQIAAHGLRVLIILLLSLIAYRWMHGVLQRMKDEASNEEGVSALIYRSGILVVKVGFWVLIAAFVSSELGFATGPILASLGIFGLAFSFGAQYLVRDVIAGFSTLREDLCEIGDKVTINGEHRGHVKQMRLRTLTLITRKGSLLHLPYGSIEMLENHSAKERRR